MNVMPGLIPCSQQQHSQQLHMTLLATAPKWHLQLTGMSRPNWWCDAKEPLHTLPHNHSAQPLCIRFIQICPRPVSHLWHVIKVCQQSGMALEPIGTSHQAWEGILHRAQAAGDPSHKSCMPICLEGPHCSVGPEQGVKLLGLLLTGSTGQHMAGRNGLA
jgi:hypothetical protein